MKLKKPEISQIMEIFLVFCLIKAFVDRKTTTTSEWASLRGSYPKAYNNITYVSDSKILKRIIDNVISQEYRSKLWFVAGHQHSEIYLMKYNEKEGILRIGRNEMKLCGIWVYISSNQYDDLLILDVKDLEYFDVNGEKYPGVVVINEKYVMKYDATEPGYVEIEGKIYDVNELEVDEKYRCTSEGYYAIGTMFHCSIFSDNEDYIEALQKEELTKEKIEGLLK
jgi:hypothetical protein